MSVPPAAPREPHLVSLKVLRAARPSLVHSTTPFTESPSILALDRATVLDGGVNGADQVLSGALMLPSTFGTIYLGETFSALLSLSNDTPDATALSPVLKVEMHTAGPTSGSKHHLKTVYAPTPADKLSPGESIEAMVQQEIKELGMHSLVCTVTYAGTVEGEKGKKATLSRSFRKVYKFQVSNPLSVRTKAHAPNALTASSTLSPTERLKVFLEVQVQNLGEHALWFARMQFEPVPGWMAIDVSNAGLFDGSSALLDAGHVRQYLFVLSHAKDAVRGTPGESEPLGRLDIEWRTPNGERGRLQTSMLGRRVPLLPVPLNLPTASAPVEKDLPPPSTPLPLPAGAPTSPSLLRSPPAPYRPTVTPVTAPPPAQVLAPTLSAAPTLEFDLTVLSITPAQILLDTPLTISFSVVVTNFLPTPRTIILAAQHVNWAAPPAPLPSPTPVPGQRTLTKPSREVIALGPSRVELQPMEIERKVTVGFEMTWLPTVRGLHRVGGVRVLVMGGEVTVGVEVDSVAEVWVKGGQRMSEVIL